jgi:methylmalonyl-CoA/ethylmalonyl-CoA epimerase
MTATIAPLALGTIGQISMTAHDVARAVGFYRDRLGLRLLFEAPPKMAFFDCDGVRLMVSLPDPPEHDHPGSVLYFRVADIRQAYTELRDRGVPFVGEPHLVARMPDHELWLAEFRDTEGNTLALMSEIR